MSKPNTADLKRPPPSYPEYASDMLASHAFKRLDSMARGVFWTLRMEWWVNGDLPADPKVLCRLVNIPADELANALPLLAPFLRLDEETGTFTIPELQTRKRSTVAIRTAQSKAGSDTAKLNKERAEQRKGANQGANQGALERVERVERVETKKLKICSGMEEDSNKPSPVSTCTVGAA